MSALLTHGAAALYAPGRSSIRPSPAALAGIVGVHALALWSFLQADTLRRVVTDVTPLMVSIVAPTPPPAAAAMPRLPAPRGATPPAAPAVPIAIPQVLSENATPAPRLQALAAPPEDDRVATVPTLQEPTPVAPAAMVAPPTAAAAPAAPAARQLPPSAVQYLVPPAVIYPRASRRLGETGRVLVKVLISESGLPEQPRIEQSSGHDLLDAAALEAVRKARFKPYSESGQPIAGWAVVPIRFDLDR